MCTRQIDHIIFNHNSDLSGDVRIFNTVSKDEMLVPGSALIQFVADYVVSQRIAKLEQASAAEVLGL